MTTQGMTVAEGRQMRTALAESGIPHNSITCAYHLIAVSAPSMEAAIHWYILLAHFFDVEIPRECVNGDGQTTYVVGAQIQQ